MAHTEKRTLWLASTAGNVAPRTVRGKIAASQGIVMPGAPMYLSQDGTWKLSDTSDGTGDTYHGFFAGMVDKATYSVWPIAAELAVSTEIYITLIDLTNEYYVYVETSGTDSAAPESIKGDEYGLAVGSDSGYVGYTTLDLGNANAAVQVVDVMYCRNPYKYDTTTAPGVAVVKFLDAVVNVSRA